MSKIIAIVGGPGTGKTALVRELARRGYHVIEEAARQVIDEGLANGETIEKIRANNERFQRAVLERKIKNENISSNQANDDEFIFSDRGMHETWAYFQTYGMNMDSDLDNMLRTHTYYRVFLLDMLDNYDREDYARTESRKEAEELHRLTELAYRRYGVKVDNLPAMSVEKRADYVLDIIF
ncbi:MAG: ATP-binding protein [Patescibacteria group bacterium]